MLNSFEGVVSSKIDVETWQTGAKVSLEFGIPVGLLQPCTGLTECSICEIQSGIAQTSFTRASYCFLVLGACLAMDRALATLSITAFALFLFLRWRSQKFGVHRLSTMTSQLKERRENSFQMQSSAFYLSTISLLLIVSGKPANDLSLAPFISAAT